RALRPPSGPPDGLGSSRGMRVVVLTGTVPAVSGAGLAPLELDRRMPDPEPLAEPALEPAHRLLRRRQCSLLDDDVAAQRRLVRGQRPDVKVVDRLHGT